MSESSIAVAVSGAAGKMGVAVCEAVKGAGDMSLTGRADPALGTRLVDVLRDADVVVDFTTPSVAFSNVKEILSAGVHAVVGTTGMSAEEVARLMEIARGGPANCVLAPNFALGAVLMMEAAKSIAPYMKRCEIVEFHHDRKVDIPSGTAERTARLIEEAGGQPKPSIHSVRLPGFVAHQEVIFGGLGETLTVRHDSISREAFMPGVLLAVRKVAAVDGLVTGLENLL